MNFDYLILECPECHSKFEVNSQQIGLSGRRVRCCECHHTWFQSPLGAEEFSLSQKEKMKEAPPPPLSEARNIIEECTALPFSEKALVSDEFIFQAPLEKKTPFLSKFTLLVFFFSSLFACLFFTRNIVVQLFPSSRSLYETLGIETSSLACFKLENTSWSQTIENGTPSILITGKVTNTSSLSLAVPLLQVTIRGKGPCQAPTWADKIFGNDKMMQEDGNCIFHKFNLNIQASRLHPHETIPFRTVYLSNNNVKVSEVLLKFVE